MVFCVYMLYTIYTSSIVLRFFPISLQNIISQCLILCSLMMLEKGNCIKHNTYSNIRIIVIIYVGVTIKILNYMKFLKFE